MGVAGNHIFVRGDIHIVKAVLKLLAGDGGFPQIEHHKVVVRSAGDNIEALFLESLTKSLGIFNNAALIVGKFRFKCFAEAYRLCRYYMFQRAALSSGENRFVDLLRIFFLAENKAAPGASEGFVGGAGNYICIGNRRHMNSCGDKSRNMRHINHKIRADLVCDFAEFCEVNGSRIGRGSRNDDFRSAFKSDFSHLFVFDFPRFNVHSVGHEAVGFAGIVHRTAVGKVSAL